MYDKGIEAFLAIASCHSIAGAARLLNLTSSALSHRLRNLEDELNMTLIDRQKGVRKSQLTMAGEKFFPVAERWSQLWKETLRIKTESEALSLAIGCVDSVNTYIMPPIYRAIREHHPSVYLKIYTNRSVVMYENIERRKLDVAFVSQEMSHPLIKQAPFFSEPMRVVRLRQPNAVSSTIRTDELDPEHELYINWGPSHQIWHDNIWDPMRKSKIELDSVTLLHALLDDTKQWAIVPDTILGKFRQNQRLMVQDLSPPSPERVTYMITHRYPRMGARQGLNILEKLSKEMGYL